MNSKMPSYIADAKPRSAKERGAWYKNIASAYAGIFLWFVFWQDIPNAENIGGSLACGLTLPILSLAVAAAVSCILFYWVSAMFGMGSGYGLSVVGSSVFGRMGGLIMPGLLMGLLQFGWLAVNIYFASKLVCGTLTFIPLWLAISVEGVAATFIGLKGIKYVAGISTYFPIIPMFVLAVMLLSTFDCVGSFNPDIFSGAGKVSSFDIFGAIVCYVVGFFATAGAAGVDFGSNARNAKDVFWGGFTGIFLAMLVTGDIALLFVAGVYGNPQTASAMASAGFPVNATEVMKFAMGRNLGGILMLLLAISAFPSACFASLIAANSFRVSMPKINANFSASCGGAAATILALTGAASHASSVFAFIGASFAPIVGAMCAEYILRRGEWILPEHNWKISGWAAWIVGFSIGNAPVYSAYRFLWLPYRHILRNL